MPSITHWVAGEKVKADSSWKHSEKGQETTDKVHKGNSDHM